MGKFGLLSRLIRAQFLKGVNFIVQKAQSTFAMNKFFFCLLLLTLSVSVMAQETLQSLYQAALTAYEEKNYEIYRVKLQKADELRPNHPTIVPRLAAAWALTGRKIRSIQTLKQMLLMDASFDFINNSEFDNIRDHKSYAELVEFQREVASVEVNDEVFRTIDAGMLHPESFVLLDNGEMLLGSIRENRIVKVDAEGNVEDWLEMPYSVLGMKYVKATDRLWVATAAFENSKNYSPEAKGHSMIVEVDVALAQVVHGVEFDDGAIIGDVEIDEELRIWHSDSNKPLLVRNVTDTADYYGPFARKYVDLQDTHFNLQGLTLDETYENLYFSDYISGIHRMNLKTDRVQKVFGPDDVLLKGIDGLYAYNNSLIAIHNGTKPYRVVQYFLDDSGLFIDQARIINRGGESLGEPTLGQVKDGYFYYLANSPWQAYDEEMNLISEQVKPIEIRRFKLD